MRKAGPLVPSAPYERPTRPRERLLHRRAKRPSNERSEHFAGAAGRAQGILRELWRRGCEVFSPASRRGVPRRASAWAIGAGARGEVFFGASWRGRGREARRGLQPSDVRGFLRCAAANEGAEANDLQPGEVIGACRRGRRRGGLQLHQLREAWGAWAAQWQFGSGCV